MATDWGDHIPDFHTDNCSVCGATRSEIEDNIYPTCFQAEGPHREALITMMRQARRAEIEISLAESRMQRLEDSVAEITHKIRRDKAKLRELEASIAAMKAHI